MGSINICWRKNVPEKAACLGAERKKSLCGKYIKQNREVVRDKAGRLGQVSVGTCKPVKKFELYPEGNENPLKYFSFLMWSDLFSPLKDFKQGSGLIRFLLKERKRKKKKRESHTTNYSTENGL